VAARGERDDNATDPQLSSHLESILNELPFRNHEREPDISKKPL